MARSSWSRGRQRRCYRPALTVAEATKTIAAESGTHFDPEIVDVLLRHQEEALSLRG